MVCVAVDSPQARNTATTTTTAATAYAIAITTALAIATTSSPGDYCGEASFRRRCRCALLVGICSGGGNEVLVGLQNHPLVHPLVLLLLVLVLLLLVLVLLLLAHATERCPFRKSQKNGDEWLGELGSWGW
jgi:hypothetical protein